MPSSRVGKTTSRMAASGARTSRRSRCPSGLTNAWTVTSFGISCARGRERQREHERRETSDARQRAVVRRPFPLRAVYTGACATIEAEIAGPVPSVDADATVRAMRMIRNVLGGACALALVACWAATLACGDRGRDAPRSPRLRCPAAAPRLQVDPLWPKPLPNHWLFGSVTGVAVDAQDHIWVVHRGDDSLNARTEMSAGDQPADGRACCLPAPPVLEFDAAGTWSATGAGPATATTGRDRPAASRSTRRATSGSQRPA